MEPIASSPLRRVAALACAATLLAACGGDADETVSTPPAEIAGSSGSDAGDDALFTERPVEVLPNDSQSELDEPVVESIAPVPETGVPGIDSNNAFCQGWSRYAGSVQALSLAWAAQPAEAAATLEVAASNAVSEAVAAMAAALPTEIESNRDALTVDVPGPFLRRADRARQALVDAGATDSEIEAAGDAWIAAIAAAGLEDENVSVSVPPEVEPKLAAAASAFRASVPSILEDPTLDTTQFDITPSLDYIFETCPDRGTLAGNDVVSSGGL